MYERAKPKIKFENGISLKADWGEFSSSLIKLISGGFALAFGKTDAAPSTLTALIDLGGSVGIEDTPGRKAWHLFWLSFAWAVSNVKFSSADCLEAERTKLSNTIKGMIERVRDKTNGPESYVYADFFERPVQLALYQILRDEFVEARQNILLDSNESNEQLRARLDSAFSRAVFEIVSKNTEKYQSLATALNAPGRATNSFELQWEAYRQKLIYDFEVQPMFGQPSGGVSLGQAYVPLRCHWHEKANESEVVHDLEAERHYSVLDDLLENWSTSPCRIEDSLKLIGGGPGSGKSTSLKRFAALLAKNPAVRPLYVPLQHLNLNGFLRDSINNHFLQRTQGAFNSPPLAREAIEDGPPIILLFDGLDEIARPGAGADEVASQFLAKLDQLLNSLRGDSSEVVRSIVTGRMPSFQSAKKFRGASGETAVEVVGYAPVGHVGTTIPIDDETGAIDQRPLWWSKFSAAAGLSPETPVAMSDPRLADVTNEPLLCYLLVLSGFAVNNWEEAAENRNLIYKRLIDEVWRRGWGDPSKTSDRRGPGRSLSMSQFNDLMETIAIAAWLGGDTRVASSQSFKSALTKTNAEEAWDAFSKDSGEDIANLAMNFYLKNSEEDQKGFEFTHKSFGEYLAARALIKMAKDVAKLFPRHTDLALQGWLEGTSTGVMTEDILTYLRDEIRLEANENTEANEEIVKLFGALSGMVKVVLSEGLPAQKLPGKNWREIANSQKNSEVTLWSVLNACVLSLRNARQISIDVGFQNDRFALRNFLVRTTIGEEVESPVKKCLAQLDADGSDLFGMDLSKADFSGSSLRKAVLSGTHLMSCNLRNCDLTDARLERANLDNARFGNAQVEGLHAIDTRLDGCDLLFASLGTVQVSARTLQSADDLDDLEEGKIYFNTERIRTSLRGSFKSRTRKAIALEEAASRKLSEKDRE
jgi:uncharacterized protein YjbI with pentapeptide repeats